MNEVPAMIGTCINCFAPANLLATWALILAGAVLVAQFELRKAK
jgi:hypothetical protein